MVLEWIQLLSWAYDKTQVSLGFNHDCTVLSANLMECCGTFAVLIFKLQKIRTTASSSFSKKKTIFTAYSALNKHCKLATNRWTGVEHSGVFLHGTIWKVFPWNFVDWCRHLKKHVEWTSVCLFNKLDQWTTTTRISYSYWNSSFTDEALSSFWET